MRWVHTLRQHKAVDLEAWEQALCEAVLSAGAKLLEKLLAGVGCGRPPRRLLSSTAQPMHSIGRREKTLQTILGPVRWRRSLFVDPDTGESRCLGDEALDVVGTSFSPGLRRRMARAGSRTSFAEAAEDLAIYAHVRVDPKDIQRIAESVGQQIDQWMNQEARLGLVLKPTPANPAKTIPLLYISFDGTGVPIRRVELGSRKGKQPDGSARTREVKLGCLFNQTSTDAEGRPVRVPESTTYVGAIESSGLFGHRLYAEALRRGLDQAQVVVVLTDGAAYNKTIVQMHFPQAVHIIDLYHARQHLYAIDELLAVRPAQQAQWLELLDGGDISRLVASLRRAKRGKPAKVRLALETQLNYFEQNAAAMHYQQFRQQGYFIGSGVVEAGCRTVIGQRLKRSGMFWSVKGANAIIASRCCQFSRRFDDFWEAAA